MMINASQHIIAWAFEGLLSISKTFCFFAFTLSSMKVWSSKGSINFLQVHTLSLRWADLHHRVYCLVATLVSIE